MCFQLSFKDCHTPSCPNIIWELIISMYLLIYHPIVVNGLVIGGLTEMCSLVSSSSPTLHLNPKTSHASVYKIWQAFRESAIFLGSWERQQSIYLVPTLGIRFHRRDDIEAYKQKEILGGRNTRVWNKGHRCWSYILNEIGCVQN